MQEASNELIEMLLDVGEDQIASKGYLFLSPVFFLFKHVSGTICCMLHTLAIFQENLMV